MAIEGSVEAFSFSSASCRCIYQVFLSFRGEDTRKTFTSHLYNVLRRDGFHTFKDDDEIEKGKNIKSELQKAIQESRASIIIFSKTYASSSWCLNELVKIIERKRTSEHVVLPIFYDVDPSHIRRQSGSVGESFVRYEQQLKEEVDDERKKAWMNKLKGWREALREAAELAGLELRNQADGDESKFIDKIVSVLRHKLSRKSMIFIDQPLIGIQVRAKKINLWLQDGSNDVGIIGICGMGGIGKTTVAKFVYNQNFERFDGCSFLHNIREISKQPKGLVALQRQLLSDICKREREKIYNVNEGLNKITKALCCKKVLLVLDDVDYDHQLSAIFGMRDWFSPGSKIIITTRHESLLKACRVDEVHYVEHFDDEESIELFCLNAFGQNHSIESSHIEYTKRIVYHCEGLPLALKVLGSSLFGKEVEVWMSQLHKLETIPDSFVMEKLKISYDSLQDDDIKNIFLHVACFFIGKDKKWTITILDACDLHTAVGISHLVDRCLLEIADDNKLKMHQLIRDMGRDIVRQESPVRGRRSRLWHPKDCFNVLEEKTGTETIEGLAFDMQFILKDKPVQSIFSANSFDWINVLKQISGNCFSWLLPDNSARSSNDDMEIDVDTFSKMRNLRLLQLNYVKAIGRFKEFPKKLRWLCWHGFHYKSIPNDLSLASVVCLDFQYSNLKQVWKKTKFLPALKILNLSHSQWLVRTPDFSGIPNLERLILQNCVHLIEVCESIGLVKGLTLVDLQDCKNLRKLPQNIGRLRFLEELIVSGCSSLHEFPVGMGNLESLKIFCANGTNMNALFAPTRDFQQQASLPRFLVHVNLIGCNLSDNSFPRDFSYLPSLKYLNLSKNFIQTLPGCIKTLRGLKVLHIVSCPRLQSIIGLPSTVISLRADFNDSLREVAIDPLNLRQASFYMCSKLSRVEHCFKTIPIQHVDKRVVNNFGLSDSKTSNVAGFNGTRVRYEYGIFSMWVLGRELPSGFFTEKNVGSSISFTLPLHPNSTPCIRGLNVGCVCVHPNKVTPLRGIKIRNETKDMSWVYCIDPFAMNYKTCEEEDIMWLSHWKFGNLFDGGDKIFVEIDMFCCDVNVREVGVKVVYNDLEEEEEETMKGTDSSSIDQQEYDLSWTEETFLELPNNGNCMFGCSWYGLLQK